MIFNSIMDLYLLSRIFRVFNRDFVEYKASNIIIYTGDIHTKFYIQILEQLNFKKLYDSNSTISTISERLKLYDFNSKISGKNACIKVDNFNIDYY